MDYNYVFIKDDGMSYQILVAEDDPASRELYYRILKKHGYNVLTAKTGAEAIQHLRQHTVDLAILDIHMPEQSGIEVMREIQAHQLATRIIVISADVIADAHPTVRAADSYLTKPFHLHRFIATVNDILLKTPA